MIQQNYPNLRPSPSPRGVKPPVRHPAVSAPQPETLATLRNRLEQWIGDHPALSVGIALIAGVTLGWLVKRK